MGNFLDDRVKSLILKLVFIERILRGNNIFNGRAALRFLQGQR